MAARAVAVRCGLPYEREAIREAAKHGVEDARVGGHEKSGWSFEQHARRYIYERIIERTARLQNEARPAPTGKRIREALENLSADQWEGLIASFGREDLYPLRSYLDDNKGELLRVLGSTLPG